MVKGHFHASCQISSNLCSFFFFSFSVDDHKSHKKIEFTDYGCGQSCVPQVPLFIRCLMFLGKMRTYSYKKFHLQSSVPVRSRLYILYSFSMDATRKKELRECNDVFVRFVILSRQKVYILNVTCEAPVGN